MCLAATIVPSDISTSPLGPTNFNPGVPTISPDSFIGALHLKQIHQLKIFQLE